MAKLEVIIVGAGIGGLTTALCLANIGCTVTIFEQADQVTEVGAGLQLSPNCSRVLIHLGLQTKLENLAVKPEAAQIRDWRTGKLLSQTALGTAVQARYGAPYYHIHRADLIALLLQAAELNTNIQIHTATEIQQVQASADTVQVCSDANQYSADLLIGADGIHSLVREQLFAEPPPRFTGNVAWRGLIKSDQLPAELRKPMVGLWWGPGKHFVHYLVRGGEWVNIVCVQEKTDWQLESWSTPGDVQELRAAFSGWHSNITTLLASLAPSQCFKWALFDRTPMKTWRCGNATLLGDACHATLPFLAQGAAMAIEDAAVLASCLQKNKLQRVAAGLKTYQSLRLARTTKIQHSSRRNARVFHLRGPAAWARNQVAARAAAQTLDWVYQYDPISAGV